VSADAVPRYRQVKELIIRRISSGELRANDRVPSEHELVDATGVSRMTANRALRELTDEGYVERIAGVGTFVADLKAASHVLEVRNIAEEVAHRGHQHSAVVLQSGTVKADQSAAAALKTKAGTGLLQVRLVHYESGVPIQLEDRYVIPDFAPDFLAQDFTVVTPSAYLSSVSPLQEAEHVVRAEMPDQFTAKHLDMADDEPCLVVSRRTWAHGQPVSFARLYHPGSRFELSGHYVPPGTKAMSRHAETGVTGNERHRPKND
jgi:GntR family histidine utilization transcriptional repressor